MSLILDRASAGLLFSATVELGPGVHVVLGAPADGTQDLASVCAGLQRPRHGSIRLLGREPWSSPETRARIGALLSDEPPEASGSVLHAVRRALGLRNDRRDAAQLLGEIGGGGWSSASPEKVPPAARRRLALGLALSHPNAALLVLFEPFSVPELEREQVQAGIRTQVERGATVLVLTASVRDAAAVGGDVILLDRGRFVRRPGEPLGRELVPGGTIALEVTSPDARKLASLLALEPAVSGVEWHAKGERLSVRGPDADALALAVARSARDSGSRVFSIASILPALDEVRGATLGLWRAAHDAARDAASANYRALQAEASKPPEPGAPT